MARTRATDRRRARTAEERRKEQLFEKQLDKMSVDYLICHDQRVGHAWQPATLDTPDGNFSLGLVCSRCSMECETFRDQKTGKSVRRYFHPHYDEYYFLRTGTRSRDQRLAIEQAWQKEMLGQLPRTKG